jgi:hypothetical protein
MTARDPGIQTLIDNYFELMHTQDMDLFGRVFHDQSTLYSAQGGAGLSLRSCEVYRSEMENRQSPQAIGNPRRDQVLLVDHISPTLALVKLQLEMFGGVMQDYLNLVYLEDQWWVMAKMWEKVGESAP